MSTFDERQNAFESKFAHDEETKFKMVARRNKLLGYWAAEKMGLDAEEREAYAKEVIIADFEEVGDDDVYRKVAGDLTKAGLDVPEHEIRQQMHDLLHEARGQFLAE